MYYIDKLKEELENIAKQIATLKDDWWSKHITGHAKWLLENALSDIAYGERLQRCFENLDLDENDLKILELMNSSERSGEYSHEMRELRSLITKTVAEVASQEREREKEATESALLGRGFAVDDDDSDILRRDKETVTFEYQRKGDLYTATYDGPKQFFKVESGKFKELIEAVQ